MLSGYINQILNDNKSLRNSFKQFFGILLPVRDEREFQSNEMGVLVWFDIKS